MREIKFRVWRPELKLMIPPEQIGVCDDSLDSYLNNEPWCYAMQYTGLKDKNGKEIYEGDIIRYERRYARAGVPSRVFKEEVQFIQYDDGEMYSDDYHLGWSTGGRTLPDVARICEVIGNIYENQELLTNE